MCFEILNLNLIYYYYFYDCVVVSFYLRDQ
jgi:hypothetical protein